MRLTAVINGAQDTILIEVTNEEKSVLKKKKCKTKLMFAGAANEKKKRTPDGRMQRVIPLRTAEVTPVPNAVGSNYV